MDDPRSTREVSSSELKLLPSVLVEHVDGFAWPGGLSVRRWKPPSSASLRGVGEGGWGEKTHLDVHEAAVKDLSEMRHDAR